MIILFSLVLMMCPAHAAEIVAYEKAQKLETGKPLEFADFTITYDGRKEKNETAQAREDAYTVKAKKSGSQKLVIKWGQAPPMPLEFKVGEQTFTLFTYSLPGTRIEPKEFAIFKKPKP